MKLVVVLLACWLALVQSATVGPQDGTEGRPPPPSDDVLQVEISPDQMPPFPFPNEDLEQREVDLPVLVHGEPQGPPGFTPRGRRPSCSGPTCSRQPPRFKLDEFPPARPTQSNLDNICAEGRKVVAYGPWNLPQTGYSHLSRQGEALNRMELGLGDCCRLPGAKRLSCSTGVWSDVVEQFCHEEFSVKTKPYHCCKLEGAKRELCFAKEAPFPNYRFQDATSLGLQERPGTCAGSDPSLCKEADLAKLPAISFPPGQPTGANIKNICALRKFRPSYPAGSLPKSGFSWLVRQAQALNCVEKGFKKCCRRQDVGCARKGWEKGLNQFCRQEFMSKTRPHHCCKEEQGQPRSSCFAREAPYPAYDKEVQLVNLAEVTPALLDMLCGQFALLTKQRPIPALIQKITEPCCKSQGDERTLCAAEAKSQFIATLCGSPRGSWKDPKKCCAQGEARDACFGQNYLSNVSLASAVEVPRPTEPSV